MTTPATLFTISAPSGAGKTSLVQALIESTPGLEVSVSHTTRARRPGEQDGVNYHFVSHDEFHALVARGEFLEHAQVFNNHYGTAQAFVEATLNEGIDVILEIDWQGARQVRQRIANAVSLFILPPSKQALKERLTGRGQDSQSVIDARMAEAQSEISHYAEADYLIVNDQFDTALLELRSVILAQRLRGPRQQSIYGALIASLLS